MIKRNKKALINQSSIYHNKLILQKFDEKVKFQYEIIDLIEKAKEVSLLQLLCMIQEAKEELGKSNVVEKLISIREERFGYV